MCNNNRKIPIDCCNIVNGVCQCKPGDECEEVKRLTSSGGCPYRESHIGHAFIFKVKESSSIVRHGYIREEDGTIRIPGETAARSAVGHSGSQSVRDGEDIPEIPRITKEKLDAARRMVEPYLTNKSEKRDT